MIMRPDMLNPKDFLISEIHIRRVKIPRTKPEIRGLDFLVEVLNKLTI